MRVFMYFYTTVLLGFEWIYAFFGNFGNLFSDETRKTLRTAPIIKGNVVGRHHQGRRRQHAGVMAEPLNARKSSAKRRRLDNSS